MEGKEILKNKTISGFVWQLIQKVSTQIISFLVSVILARLLAPEDYGVVALSSMFIILMGIFINEGLGTALIQKKDADEIDFNTVFFSGLGMAIILYTIIFYLSPVIATAFGNEQITPVIRVMALNMPLGALNGVQCAVLMKRMQFKMFFYSSTIGSIISAIVGLSMAYANWGVWALVAQSLTSTLTHSIVLQFIGEWHPRFQFSFRHFKSLFSYGFKLMMSSFIGTFFSQLKGYLIGIKYKPTDLAYYNRGDGMPSILFNTLNNTINSVVFPVLSQLQNDKNAVKQALSRTMRVTSFFLMPALLGLAAISDKLVIIIFTEKWASAIPFMQIICLIDCFSILGTANLQALKAIGKADTILKLEIYKKPILILTLLACIRISPLMIAIGELFYSLYSLIWNALPNKKYIDYSLWHQLKDVSPNLILSILMAVFVYILGRIPGNIYLVLTMQILVGFIIYFLLCKFFNKDNLEYGIFIIKQKILKI